MKVDSAAALATRIMAKRAELRSLNPIGDLAFELRQATRRGETERACILESALAKQRLAYPMGWWARPPGCTCLYRGRGFTVVGKACPVRHGS